MVNLLLSFPDSKVRGVNMGPTWVLSAPDGPHVGPMNFAIWVCQEIENTMVYFTNIAYGVYHV